MTRDEGDAAAERGASVEGWFRVRGTDEVLWDIVRGTIGPGARGRSCGELYPRIGSELSWWSGPVILELPDGRRGRAIVVPEGAVGDRGVARIAAFHWEDRHAEVPLPAAA